MKYAILIMILWISLTGCFQRPEPQSLEWYKERYERCIRIKNQSIEIYAACEKDLVACLDTAERLEHCP